MALVTLEQAINHLRLTIDTSSGSDDPDLPTLNVLIDAASAAVLGYIKMEGSSAYTESDVPDDIRAATLILLGYFWQWRGDDEPTREDRGMADGYLPKPVTMLLYRYRMPSFA